jgi:ribosomal protein S14
MLCFFRKLARKGELLGRKLIGWKDNIKMIL